LGSYGARVIRVERPGDLFNQTDLWLWGDDAASLTQQGMAGRYFQVNCNKESLLLDYTSEGGKEVFLKLIQEADVLVEGFRPGVMYRYGLDYIRLQEVNPRLVYCSITGYGCEGPYSQLPSHDPNIQALAGIMQLTQGAEGPGLPGIPVGDILAGNNAAIAILMALLAREKGDGRGQHLDVSMLDGAVWAVGITRADAYFATGKYLGPNRRPLHIYKTLDEKYICLVVVEEKFWQTLCTRLKLEEYAKDWAKVIPYSEGSPRRKEIIGRLTEIFKTNTREAWFELLSDCCLTPVLDFEEVLADGNTKARELILYLQDPNLGLIPCLGVPFRMSRTPGQIRSLPPLKGEHTERIFSELDLTRDGN
jgi:crotonobetainyl-CoA:carnitine CoA-transferase CaiB-like acyl-CoA transferase